MSTLPAPADTTYDLTPEDAAHLAEVVTQEINHGSQVPVEQVLAVEFMRERGKSVQQIADALNMDTRTIRGIQLRAEHGHALAQKLLKSGVITHVKEWQQASAVAAQKGRHEPARDALIAAGVIEMKPSQQTHIQVGIVLNGGSAPAELPSGTGK